MSDPIVIAAGVVSVFSLLIVLAVTARVARDIRDDYREHGRALGEADQPVGGPVRPGRGSETVSLAECTPRVVSLADRRRERRCA